MEIHQGAGGTRRSGLGDTLLFLDPQGQGSGSGRSIPLSVVSERLTCVGPCAEPWWGPGYRVEARTGLTPDREDLGWSQSGWGSPQGRVREGFLEEEVSEASLRREGWSSGGKSCSRKVPEAVSSPTGAPHVCVPACDYL